MITMTWRDQLMSEDGRERALEAFIDELNRVRQTAGPPSYAKMERLSRRLENAGETASGVRVITLARSTTNDILTGDRRDRPKWEWVASYWAVLRLIAEQSGVDPDRLGTLEEWRRKYDAIDAVAARPGDAWPRPPATGETGTWWHAYQDVVPEWFQTYLSLEPAADFIHVYEPHYVPGLLQTDAYARAIVRRGLPDESPDQSDRRVELRMRRQPILRVERPVRLWAVLDERALRAHIGDPVALRGQIAHLLEICELPNVTVQVRPRDARGPDAADNPVCLMRFAESTMPDLIYLEQETYALYPDRPQDIKHYLEVLDRLAGEALPPERTPEVLRRLLDDLDDLDGAGVSGAPV